MHYSEYALIGIWLSIIVLISVIQLYALSKGDDPKSEVDPNMWIDLGIVFITMPRTSYMAISLYLLPLIGFLYVIPSSHREVVYVALLCFSSDALIQIYTRSKPGRKRVVQLFKHSIYYLVVRDEIKDHYLDHSFVLRYMRDRYKRKEPGNGTK